MNTQRASGSMRSTRAIQRSIDEVRANVLKMQRDTSVSELSAEVTQLKSTLEALGSSVEVETDTDIELRIIIDGGD